MLSQTSIQRWAFQLEEMRLQRNYRMTSVTHKRWQSLLYKELSSRLGDCLQDGLTGVTADLAPLPVLQSNLDCRQVSYGACKLPFMVFLQESDLPVPVCEPDGPIAC